MDTDLVYLLCADAILFLHVLFVLFVVLGLLLVLVGGVLKWRWVRNPFFRGVHLLAIGLVVLQAWLDMACPLTIWEMALREKAGAVVYKGSCIAYWLERLLYVQAPPWVFTVVYTVFGSAVVASWYFIRPRKHKR